MLYLLLIIFAQQELELQPRGAQSVVTRYIEITKPDPVEIRVRGGLIKRNTRSPLYCWILDSKTRRVVWQMNEASYESDQSKHATYRDTFTLRTGYYEVILSRFRPSDGNVYGQTLWDVLRQLKVGIINTDKSDYGARLQFTGRIVPEPVYLSERFPVNEKIFFSNAPLKNQTYTETAIEVKQSVDLRIYALGEMVHQSRFDYAWIKEAASNRIVWSMEFERARYAGGGFKNRFLDERLTLAAGRYIIVSVSDDSHAYNRWNDGMPMDPMMYGMTVLINDADEAKLRILGRDEFAYLKPLLRVDRLRNNTYEERAFEISKPVKVRVYAIGEADNEKMVDYSWITRESDDVIVWKMTYDRSRPAGGASRNRMQDEVIELDEGTYVLHAVTNSSHAYRKWRYERPYDDQHWGVSLYPLSRVIQDNAFSEIDLMDERDILVNIRRMRNSHKEKRSFVMNSDGDVNIYSIGEGSSNGMFDYGMILDAETNRVVWKMTYDKTVHAGGADRNRKFKGSVRLPAGSYIVIYRTDAFHAFGDWADEPPFDRDRYGIQIYRKFSE